MYFNLRVYYSCQTNTPNCPFTLWYVKDDKREALTMDADRVWLVITIVSWVRGPRTRDVWEISSWAMVSRVGLHEARRLTSQGIGWQVCDIGQVMAMRFFSLFLVIRSAGGLDKISTPLLFTLPSFQGRHEQHATQVVVCCTFSFQNALMQVIYLLFFPPTSDEIFRYCLTVIVEF